MVSASNQDYMFGYFIWILAHPELRGTLFDSEYDFVEMGIHAVNPFVGLDGNYNYLDYCDAYMSRGGQVADHYQIWNCLMNNIITLEPIFTAKFRCLMKEFSERYVLVVSENRHDHLSNDDALRERYEFILSLNIQFTPIANNDEYYAVHKYVRVSARTLDDISESLHSQFSRRH